MQSAAASWPQAALAAVPNPKLALSVVALGAVLSWLAFGGVQRILAFVRLDDAAERSGIGAVLRRHVTLTEGSLLAWFVAWIVLAASTSVGLGALGVAHAHGLAAHLFTLGLRAVVVAVAVTFGLALRRRVLDGTRR